MPHGLQSSINELYFLENKVQITKYGAGHSKRTPVRNSKYNAYVIRIRCVVGQFSHTQNWHMIPDRSAFIIPLVEALYLETKSLNILANASKTMGFENYTNRIQTNF